MIILVEGKKALIKKNSKIDFISENRRFTGADSYTLSITFPLRGCPQNTAIFGHLQRKDVVKESVRLQAEIQAGRLRRQGVLTPTEVTEAQVKCQFLEGQSIANFAPDLDKTYINQIPLGQPARTTLNPATYTGSKWDFAKSISGTNEYVCLPWVNNYSGNLQNAAIEQIGSQTATEGGLSAQIYLYYMAVHVCRHLGFSYDFTEWWDSPYRHLVVCNTLPHAWDMPQFQHAMPKWSVTEFFEELEKLMDCEITVDYKHFKVTLRMVRSLYPSLPMVRIDKVVEEYTATVSDKNETEYREAVNVGYSEADHPLHTYYSAAKMGDLQCRADIYDSMAAMLEHEPSAPHRGLIYCRQEQRCFVWRRVGQEDQYGSFNLADFILQEVGQFGVLRGDPSTEDVQMECAIVPVEIEHTSYHGGWAMYLDPGELEDTASDVMQWEGAALVEAEGDSGSDGFYDKMFVAFWDGTDHFGGAHFRPYVDTTENNSMSGELRFAHPPYSLKLAEQPRVFPIDARTKYTFSFLSNDLPDARSIFFIRGHRYVCAKLTATITEQGMSELVKGEFYLLKE